MKKVRVKHSTVFIKNNFVDNFKKIQKSEEEHNSDELNLKDIIKIISDAKSEDAEMNNNESKNDVIGDCKICLENIR